MSNHAESFDFVPNETEGVAAGQAARHRTRTEPFHRRCFPRVGKLWSAWWRVRLFFIVCGTRTSSFPPASLRTDLYNCMKRSKDRLYRVPAPLGQCGAFFSFFLILLCCLELHLQAAPSGAKGWENRPSLLRTDGCRVTSIYSGGSL